MTANLDRATVQAMCAADALLAVLLDRLARHLESAGLLLPPMAYTRLLGNNVCAAVFVPTASGGGAHLVIRSYHEKPWLTVEQNDDCGEVMSMGDDADGMARWLTEWLLQR